MHLRVALAAIVCSLLVPPVLAAAAMPGVELPEGETLVDAAWTTNTTMVLVVAAQTGYALRGLDLASGDLTVIGVPKDFTHLRQPKPGEQPFHLALAAHGNALALLEPASDPLSPPLLSVYKIAAGQMTRAGDTRLPRDFWPDKLAWGDGGELYLSAIKYLFPDQLYSVCKYELKSGEFTGVVLKGNADLIDDMYCLPQRDALVLRCNSYKGEYPTESVLVLYDLAHNGLGILHSRAGGLECSIGLDGSLFAVEAAPKSQGKAGEAWVLQRNADSLARMALDGLRGGAAVHTSPNGAWVGYATGDGKDQPTGLALRNLSTGATMQTATACDGFWFAPDSRFVCAYTEREAKLYFYELPH